VFSKGTGVEMGFQRWDSVSSLHMLSPVIADGFVIALPMPSGPRPSQDHTVSFLLFNFIAKRMNYHY
jgi:hypothetical protein